MYDALHLAFIYHELTNLRMKCAEGRRKRR